MSDSPKLKGRLLVRMWYYQIFAVLSGAAVAYEIVRYEFNPIIAAVCALITGGLGFYGGTKYQVAFDEEQNLVAHRYGRLGWIILACYVALRGVVNTTAADLGAHGNTAIGVSAAVAFGYYVGRWIGLTLNINRVKAGR